MGNNEAMLDDNSMSLIDDLQMDMDIDTPALDFSTSTPASNTNVAQNPSQSHSEQQSTITQPRQPAEDMFNTTTSTPGGVSTDNNVFADFDADANGADGLIDFDGGEGDIGFDMDNSAFGDAFHGTEAHGGEGDGAGN